MRGIPRENRVKIYTRTGDGGDTGLFGGGRVSKAHVRVEAYGTVDELNAHLGVCLDAVEDLEIRDWLERIQQDLFRLGAVLATPGAEDGPSRPAVPEIPEGRIREMEAFMDGVEEELPELKAFILPGGSPGASQMHVGRTVCRRAERAVVRLTQVDDCHPVAVSYLNRLSDLLFTLARLENHRNGVPDVPWEKDQV
jgi:cob(I)alamin adenosyltransferase